jgi:hypothetical protein
MRGALHWAWSRATSREAAEGALAVAFGLVALPGLSLVLTQLLLLAGGHLSPLTGRVILATVVAAALLLVRFSGGGRWAGPLLFAALTLAATAASALVIDTSFDGQQYHYDAINGLAHGWNPYLTADGPPLAVPDIRFPWAGHYPMGAWLGSAVQVAAGLSPEAAKTPGLFLFAALFLAVFGVGLKWGLSGPASLAIAVAAAVNPVIVVQLFSRMNDGLLGACYALTLLFGAAWVRERQWRWAAAAALALVLGINLKFSGAVHLIAPCAMICVLALVQSGWRTAARAAAFLMTVAVASVLVFGAHPYVTNTLRMGHPFYPLMGAGAADIMTDNRPEAFNPMTPGERIVAAYLAPTSSAWADGGWREPLRVKAPFTVDRSEIWVAGLYDNRLAGFGPLFSGALIIALGGAALLLAHRPWGRPAAGLLALSVAVLATGLAMPEAWWARYVPQVWWAPALAAAAMLASPGRLARMAGWALAVVLLLDAGLVAASSARRLLPLNLEIRRELARVDAIAGPICVRARHGHARVELLRERKPELVLMTEPLPAACSPTPLAGVDAVGAAYCPCP